jgi:pilus assembly protein CpaC
MSRNCANACARSFPAKAVEVRTANDGIVLSGTVSSLQAVDRAMQLAERYTPGGVSNLMLVGGTQQVMLQVRFAEMQRTVRQELSTSLGGRPVTWASEPTR